MEQTTCTKRASKFHGSLWICQCKNHLAASGFSLWLQLFGGFFFFSTITAAFLVLHPLSLLIQHSCIKLASLNPSLSSLHPETMCGMSFQLPPYWRRAPNKTKQLYFPSLGPGLHPLSLFNSPLPPVGPSLWSSPSVAVCVTISWAEGLLSASGVERLADFRLHVSFKGLRRNRGAG